MPAGATSLDYLTAIGSIGSILTPILVLILTGIGWTIQQRVERRKKLDELLRADRINVYNQILEPFIIILAKQDKAQADNKGQRGPSRSRDANDLVRSIEYRQAAFKLALMGSDSVVRAYNDLMQFFYEQAPTTESSDDKKQARPLEMMNLFGRFLLEIRRSVGNEKTSLDNIEMLEWLINDIRRFRPQRTETRRPGWRRRV